MNRAQGSSEPHVEEVRQFGVLDVVVVRRVSRQDVRLSRRILCRLLPGERRRIDDEPVKGLRGQLNLRRPSARRSEEHTSELQSLMRISYAVFCLKKKKINH